MISVIKRVFRRPEQDRLDFSIEDPLQVPEEVEPRTVDHPEGPEAEHKGYFVPYDPDAVQQQVEMVRAAIAQGGRFGDREIPIPWLRMMLAGLEGRHIEQDEMWEGIAAPPRKDPVEESPTYQELFPKHT